MSSLIFFGNFSLISKISTLDFANCTVDDIAPLANTSTKIIVLDGMIDDWKNLYNTLDYTEWDFDNSFGPECHLCGDVILDFTSQAIHNGIAYTVIWKGDSLYRAWTTGYLQCCYCFNYYHRNRCSLTMSDTSFFNVFFYKELVLPLLCPYL